VSCDWDCASDNLAPRAQAEPGSATVALVNAAVWLICTPFDLYARLRNGRSTTGDRSDQGADWGSEHLHNGPTITTKTERDHG